MSSICGGVISHTQSIEDMKKYGVWANAMAYVMPDDKYEEYVEAKLKGREKEATKLFNLYARSTI